jgi:hypothetical protein
LMSRRRRNLMKTSCEDRPNPRSADHLSNPTSIQPKK